MTVAVRGWRTGVVAAVICAAPAVAAAQQISVDRGARAAGLWCFPLATDPKTYVYLPSSARLATDDSGRPQFSFVRYLATAAPGTAGQESITASGGGGIHCATQQEPG